jgi:hypothetical protein
MVLRRAAIALARACNSRILDLKKTPRRHFMRSRRPVELWVALFLYCAGTLLAGSASAVPFWTVDQDISGGDVNDTFTASSGQRFMAVDDSNNLYVAFFDNRFKIVGGDNNYEIFFRRFIYNFGSPSITRVTNAPNMSKYPALATRNWGAGDYDTQQDSGRVYIVWQDGRLFPVTGGDPPSYTIFMRTFRSMGGAGFGPEFQVSPFDTANAATLPVVTVGDSNRVWIAWQKPATIGTNTTALFSCVYHSNTGALDPIVQLTPGVVFAGNASISASRDGVVHLVWVDQRSGAQQIWTKRFVPGTGWTADEQLVFSSVASAGPSITTDYHNHAHLVWSDRRSGNDIFYKEYIPGVGWDPLDTQITFNASSQIQPFVDADPMSNVYTVWTDSRNGSSDPDIFYDTRRMGTWAGNTPLVYAATDTSNSVQQAPGIVHDEFGTAYVAWTDERLPASIGKNREVFYKVGLDVITAVPVSEKPALARLLRNYPNPFNPITRVQFTLDRSAQVSLRVFDVQGRVVRTLLDSYLSSGPRVIAWDGRDDRGRQLPSGTYFLRLVGGGSYLSRTVNLVK